MSSSSYLVVDTKNTVSLSTHPDNLTIDETSGYGIEKVRSTIAWSILKPFNRTYKFILISQAQNLGNEAQNALLKSLEEPPKHTTFILTVSNQSQLLDTIKSRCRMATIQELIDNENLQLKDELITIQPLHSELLPFPTIQSEADVFTIAETYAKQERALLLSSIEAWCEYLQSVDPIKTAPIVSVSYEAFLHIKANGNTKLNLVVLLLTIAKLKDASLIPNNT